MPLNAVFCGQSRGDGKVIRGLFLASLMAVASAPQEPAETLRVEAWVSTAGPYGESWSLKIDTKDKATLEIGYMLNPLGTMSGEFLVNANGVAALRKAIENSEFAKLPKSLWPGTAPLHRPDLRLTIMVGKKAHEVSVYDPEQFVADPRFKRFMAVWNSAFDLVPIRPKW